MDEAFSEDDYDYADESEDVIKGIFYLVFLRFIS